MRQQCAASILINIYYFFITFGAITLQSRITQIRTECIRSKPDMFTALHHNPICTDVKAHPHCEIVMISSLREGNRTPISGFTAQRITIIQTQRYYISAPYRNRTSMTRFSAPGFPIKLSGHKILSVYKHQRLQL